MRVPPCSRVSGRSRSRASGAIGLLLVVLLAPACRSFGPPREATLRRLAGMPLAEELDGQAQLELDCEALSGVFDVVWGGEGDSVRVQLFPDVGGKVFDLRFSAKGIDASSPDGSYHAAAPLDAAPPHLAVVLALVFAEIGTPPTPERVLGERVGPSGLPEVRLRPALGAGRAAARLDAEGRVSGYSLGLGHVELELDGEGHLSGPGFRGRLCR